LDSVIDVYLASVQSADSSPSLFAMVLDADPIVQLDLLILIGMSLATWAIIARKASQFRRAENQTRDFLDMFWKARRLDQIYEQTGGFEDTPICSMFQESYQELRRVQQNRSVDMSDNITRTLRRTAQVERVGLERFLPFLATTGATAPFIGLFGTVWGILMAFMKLGKPGAAATIQVVGPDIAHALIATAVGLVAAIPAVMAYNYFNSRLRLLNTEMDNFSDDLINLIKRQLQ